MTHEDSTVSQVTMKKPSSFTRCHLKACTDHHKIAHAMSWDYIYIYVNFMWFFMWGWVA